MLPKDFLCAWKTHLEGQGREADSKGCDCLLKQHTPHVIFIWSAAGCRAPIGEAHCCMGVEPTVRAFWNAASDSLAALLSDWLTLADGERQACDGPDLARKAVAHIRASWPAWPRLGDDDATRLTRYVVSEKVLQSAWSQVCALPADALVVPRRKSNPGCRLTEAVRYAVQSSAVDGTAAAIRKKPKKTQRDSACSARSGLDTLAHAAALAVRVADSVPLSREEAASPAPTEPDASFLAAPVGEGHEVRVREDHEVLEERDRSSFEREDLLSNSPGADLSNSPGSPFHGMVSPAEQSHSPGLFVDSLLRTPTSTSESAPAPATLSPSPPEGGEGGQLSVGKPAAADKVADNGGGPAATATSAGSRGEPPEPGKGTSESAPAPATLSAARTQPPPEPGEGTSAEGGQLSVGKPAAADKVAATATSAARGIRLRGRIAGAGGSHEPAASRYVFLPRHRWMVVHLQYWFAILMREKKVEFRVRTALEPGMSLLISMDASQRRLGRTELLLAKVSEVCTLRIEEAYSRFPVESKACNLRGLWGGRSSVDCIGVRNVRVTTEFVLLGPGNLGCLNQFSAQNCRPQFCHRSDLGKTVAVTHNGQTVQRRMLNTRLFGRKSAPCIGHGSPGGEEARQTSDSQILISIPSKYLIVQSCVTGLFKSSGGGKEEAYPGKIHSIEGHIDTWGRVNQAKITVKFNDGDTQIYETASSTIDKELLHDIANEDDTIWMWNVVHYRWRTIIWPKDWDWRIELTVQSRKLLDLPLAPRMPFSPKRYNALAFALRSKSWSASTWGAVQELGCVLVKAIKLHHTPSSQDAVAFDWFAWSQLKQILRVSEEGEVLGTVTDAIREAKLFRPAPHSGDAMSSAVHDERRRKRGDHGDGDGGSVRISKQARKQLEQLHSGPESDVFGVSILLNMEMLDVNQDAVMDGRAWNDSPYAVVKGKIGTVEEQRLFVHSVLGQGDCLYLALAITVFKAWSDGATDALRTVLPGECFKRLSQIIEIGQRNVQGEDTRGLEFRRLLADFAKTGGDKLELALEACGAARPRGRRLLSKLSRRQVQAAQMDKPGNYGDEGTLTVLKHFLPCLKLHLFVTEGDELVPCRHYLDPSMNSFPEGYDGFQLSIALHLRMAAGNGGSDFNHYQAVTGIKWSNLPQLSDPSVATAAVRSQDAAETRPPGQPPSGPVGKSGDKRCSVKPTKSQPTLHAFGFAAAVCSKCGGPGVFNCTQSDGSTPCAISYCLACMGYAESFKCPQTFQCEYHREVLESEATVKFQNKSCWECRDNKAIFKCRACHKRLCSTHAQKTPTAGKIFAKDDRCRACMGRPKFAEIRIEAAEYLLGRILGTFDKAERPGLDGNTGRLDSLVQSKFDSHGKQMLSALVDEFSIYVYTLSVCGLCEPAADYFKLLIKINLKMNNLQSSMGLLPMHFMYMMSSDGTNELANGAMLDKVVSAHAEHILSCERQRRNALKLSLDTMGGLDSHRAWKGGRIKVGVFAYDLLRTSPTHDLLYGKLQGGWDKRKYELILITFSTKEEPTSAGEHEYDATSPSVRSLVRSFRGRIVYLYERYSDETNLATLKELNLDVLHHANAFCHRHVWHLLLMDRVALVYIEVLAMPSLLLSFSLSDFTICSPGLLSPTQHSHAVRERIIWVPWLYGTETYYLEDMLNNVNAVVDDTPCLGYLGGLGRLNEKYAICLAMEIIHACGGIYRVFVQTNPDTMFSELRRMASEFCTAKGWRDYSVNIVIFPHYFRKAHFIRFGQIHRRMVLFAVGSVQPHTGTVDGNTMGLACLCLESEGWAGKVPCLNNVRLGLKAFLNATSKADFIEKGIRLLKDSDLLDGIVEHIRRLRLLKKGQYQEVPFLQLAAEMALNAVVEARGDRSKLVDIDLTRDPRLNSEPVPEFDGGSREISRLGVNTGMRVSAIMGKMAEVTRYPWGENGRCAETLLESLELQAGLRFLKVVGWGGSRFAILAHVEMPDEPKRASDIRWVDGMQAIVKLLHPSKEGELPSTSRLYNDSNVREHKILTVARAAGARFKRMTNSVPKLLRVLPGCKSAGYMRCGSDADAKALTFLVCESVGETWYRSDLRSEITSAWRKEGALSETFRTFVRNLLHGVWFLHHHLGISIMDCSTSNICEASYRIPWLFDEDVQNQMPRPAGIVFCDLGSAYDIGTHRQRADGDVRHGNHNRDKPLQRLKTTDQAAARVKKRKHPRLPPGDKNGIVFLGASDIQRIFEHRRGEGGLGRMNLGTRGNRCELIADFWKTAATGTVLSANDCIDVDAGSLGNIIFGHVSPQDKEISDEDYDELKQKAAQSPESMLAVIESVVDEGVTIKQPDTVASLANLLYWMLHRDLRQRIDILTALCHPFTSLRILSPEDYEATRNAGYIFPGGLGPPGSPWEKVTFPTWIAKHVPGKGLGGFAGEGIPRGSTKPCALYCALFFGMRCGESIDEWPPGRCNISIDAAACDRGLGELPLALLRDRRSPGVIFNTADASAPHNLRLDRTKAWQDRKGLVYMPMFASKDLEREEEGLWYYDFTSGAAGGRYSFDDRRFRTQ